MYSTPIGTNTTNSEISHLESTPVGEKMPDAKPLTQATESQEEKEKKKNCVPEDPYPDPTLSDSSFSKSDLSDDSKYKMSNIKRNAKRKKLKKRKVQD